MELKHCLILFVYMQVTSVLNIGDLKESIEQSKDIGEYAHAHSRLP